MNKEQAKAIIEILESRKGDDLYRAEKQFKNCTLDEMKQEYGLSGRTRQQIVDGYRNYNAKIDSLIAAVREVSL